MSNAIHDDFYLKTYWEKLIEYFRSFDEYVNYRDYIDYLIKYNQVNVEESLENYF